METPLVSNWWMCCLASGSIHPLDSLRVPGESITSLKHTASSATKTERVRLIIANNSVPVSLPHDLSPYCPKPLNRNLYAEPLTELEEELRICDALFNYRKYHGGSILLASSGSI